MPPAATPKIPVLLDPSRQLPAVLQKSILLFPKFAPGSPLYVGGGLPHFPKQTGNRSSRRAVCRPVSRKRYFIDVCNGKDGSSFHCSSVCTSSAIFLLSCSREIMACALTGSEHKIASRTIRSSLARSMRSANFSHSAAFSPHSGKILGKYLPKRGQNLPGFRPN